MEIEILTHGKARKEYITREFQGFFRYIGAVLQCIQGSNFILSNAEQAQVRRDEDGEVCQGWGWPGDDHPHPA